MISSRHITVITLALIALLIGTPVGAEDYPGVYSNDNSLIFIQSSDEYDTLQGVVMLSFEFSMDWVITTGNQAVITDAGLLLTDGNQYVYQADGSRVSETEFNTMDYSVAWDDMEFRVLPTYGHYLGPMVHGGIAYALVETSSGLPTQIVLASEAFDTGPTINLFNGFVYQLSGGSMNAQIAFTEVAFGTQGLVRGEFPEDFPPPPEDYPNPYPDYPDATYPPPGGMYNSGTGDPVDPVNNYDSSLPSGTLLDPDERSDMPQFTLEPIHDYDVPPIIRLGVVAFKANGEAEPYGPSADEFIQELLGDVEGIEVVYIPFDSSRFGGAVQYDRAVWLCEEHGVDALLLSEIDDVEIPGAANARAAGSAHITIEIQSELVEGAGGSTFWEGDFESDQIHDFYEVQDGIENAVRYDLSFLIRALVDDLETSGVLDGGHVD